MSAPAEALCGRCLCGRVTFASDDEPAWVAHCHCESCRRNCAAPYTTFFGAPRKTFRWTGEKPAEFESSNGVRRLFCATCGTPMAYDADDDATNIHLYVAALTDPETLRPTCHVHHEEKLGWVNSDDGLKKYAGRGSAALT